MELKRRTPQQRLRYMLGRTEKVVAQCIADVVVSSRRDVEMEKRLMEAHAALSSVLTDPELCEQPEPNPHPEGSIQWAAWWVDKGRECERSDGYRGLRRPCTNSNGLEITIRREHGKMLQTTMIDADITENDWRLREES